MGKDTFISLASSLLSKKKTFTLQITVILTKCRPSFLTGFCKYSCPFFAFLFQRKDALETTLEDYCIYQRTIDEYNTTFIVNKKTQHNVVNDVVLDVFTVNLEEI